MRLYLVRHAAVVLDVDRPAPEWRLTEAGREAAAELARSRSWDGVVLVATSPEPKARDTATPIAAAVGIPLRVEPGLREVERGSQPVLEREEYVALVERYLRGEPVEGWEPAAEASARFTAAVEGLLAEATGDVVAVTHGLVIALYLGLDRAAWANLALPDVLEVSAKTPASPEV